MNFLTQSFLALSFLFAVSLPGNAEVGIKEDLQVAQSTVCATTESDFLDSAMNTSNAKVFIANAKARETIVSEINNARVKAKLWHFEVDTLRIGIIKHNGQILIGIAMFKDKCVVPGSVQLFPAAVFINEITKLGLDMDDFTPEQES